MWDFPSTVVGGAPLVSNDGTLVAASGTWCLFPTFLAPPGLMIPPSFLPFSLVRPIAMEHCRGAPLAALAASALAGDRPAIEAAAAALPPDILSAAAAKAPAMAPLSTGVTSVTSAPAAAPRSAKGKQGSLTAAGIGEEVCGPVSSGARRVVEAAARAGASWAAWRLGLLWTRRVAEATGM